MAPRSRFPDEVRRAAVQRAFDHGATAKVVAAEIGVSVPTLYRWASDLAASPSTASPTATDDATATRLLDAAAELLRTQGYAEVSVEQVAAAAAVPLRTAFHRFPTKRALFGAMIDRAARAAQAEIARQSTATTWPIAPRDRLRVFLRIAAEAAYAEPGNHVLFRDLGVPADEHLTERWHVAMDDALLALLETFPPKDLGGLDAADAAPILASMMRGVHAAVFEGAPREVALTMVERLARVVEP